MEGDTYVSRRLQLGGLARCPAIQRCCSKWLQANVPPTSILKRRALSLQMLRTWNMWFWLIGAGQDGKHGLWNLVFSWKNSLQCCSIHNLYTYIYIYVYMYVCIYIYIYVCIYVIIWVIWSYMAYDHLSHFMGLLNLQYTVSPSIPMNYDYPPIRL